MMVGFRLAVLDHRWHAPRDLVAVLRHQLGGGDLQRGIADDLIRDRDDDLAALRLRRDLLGRQGLVRQPLELREQMVIEVGEFVLHLSPPCFALCSALAFATSALPRSRRRM
jgi:hypothetical protein